MPAEPKRIYTMEEYLANERIWYLTDFNDRGESIYLPSLGCTLKLDEIYQGVIVPA